MSKTSELASLIREQQADMKRGPFQPRESFVVFSIDQSYQTKYFDDRGVYYYRRSRGKYSGCPVHGMRDLVVVANGAQRCRGCERDHKRMERRAKGVKPKGIGPQCGHDPKNFHLRPDKYLTCNECKRLRMSRYRAQLRCGTEASTHKVRGESK